MLLVFIHTLIAFICLFEISISLPLIKRRIFRSVVFFSIGIIFGIVPIITTPWHERLTCSYDTNLEAGWFALLGTLFLSLGATYAEFIFRNIPINGSFIGIRDLNLVCTTKAFYRFLIAAAVLGILGWLGTIYFSGASLSSAITTGRLAFRGHGNTILVGISGHVFILNYVVAFLCWFIRQPLLRIIVFCYSALLIAGVFFLSSGTRFESIALIGSLCAGYLLAHNPTPSKLLKIGVVGIAVFAVTAIAVPLRHRIKTLQPHEILPFIFSSERFEPILSTDPLNYHDTVVQVIDAFPARYDFVNAATYRRIMFFPIPSSIAPALKPPDPNRTVAQALFGYELANSIDWMHPPGIFGDVWINFWGWKGLFVFLFLGGATTYLGIRLLRDVFSLIWLGPLFGCLTILFVRGQPYLLFIKFLAAYLLVSVLMKTTGLSHTLAKIKHQRRQSLMPLQRKLFNPAWDSSQSASLQTAR